MHTNDNGDGIRHIDNQFTNLIDFTNYVELVPRSAPFNTIGVVLELKKLNPSWFNQGH